MIYAWNSSASINHIISVYFFKFHFFRINTIMKMENLNIYFWYVYHIQVLLSSNEMLSLMLVLILASWYVSYVLFSITVMPVHLFLHCRIFVHNFHIQVLSLNQNGKIKSYFEILQSVGYRKYK